MAKNGNGKKRGRPSKFDEVAPEVIKILETTGCYKETASWYCGIDPKTLVNWLKKGREEKKGKYRDFFLAVEKAQSSADARDLVNIQKAALGGSWQASAWRLERKNPRAWGRRDPNRTMVALEEVKEMASKIILAVNRTVKSQKERIALAEQILQAAGEVQAKKPFKNGNGGNGNGKKKNGNGKNKGGNGGIKENPSAS